MLSRDKTLKPDRNVELTALYEISKVLSSSIDLPQTVSGVLKILSTYFDDVRRCMISLVQESGDLHVIGASNMSPEAIARGRFREGEGVSGGILRNGIPVVIPDISKEPRFLNRTGSRTPEQTERTAFIGVPIKNGREIVGVLSYDREFRGMRRNFENDVQFLQMVANLIGQTVRLHQLVAAEREFLMGEKHRLQKALPGKYNIEHMVGSSKVMQAAFAEVFQAAQSRSTVLLRGESGTGKELIARAIHYLSGRKEGPFVKVNCAALTETLLESELFGHERGAFTGATQERKGRFELANKGTLFLDEIGDVSPAFQAKLLRVLQEREFERVGGTKTIKIDVRLVGATNRNLEDAVTRGQFREDLYYRLNVVTISLPPLRERRDDIAGLVQHFLQRFCAESGRQLTIAEDAMAVLKNCAWPGNVRELENCVERIATMTRGNVIREVDLACRQNMCFSQALHHYGKSGRHVPVPVVPAPISASEEDDADEVPEFTSERERVVWALEQCGWVQARAARMLNLTPRQIGYAILKYKIPVKKL
ncbi:MAG: nif-specific transcriptional activator NifA [Gammaproteobacteria bacterium]|nr:nif-specific transcriptional activator NifA [Gammaproteobacteria bacterium]